MCTTQDLEAALARDPQNAQIMAMHERALKALGRPSKKDGTGGGGSSRRKMAIEEVEGEEDEAKQGEGEAASSAATTGGCVCASTCAWKVVEGGDEVSGVQGAQEGLVAIADELKDARVAATTSAATTGGCACGAMAAREGVDAKGRCVDVKTET
eukprot:1145471-Pelagomonas_calceolata.AAC.6